MTPQELLELVKENLNQRCKNCGHCASTHYGAWQDPTGPCNLFYCNCKEFTL